MLESNETYQAIVNDWSDIVDMKNPYQFGEEIDMEQFSSILKQTYEWICELKGKIISGQSTAAETFAFADLISIMSQYIPDTCTDDESEDHLFTVTCMLTEALLEFATNGNDIKLVGETIKADGKNGSHKIFYIPNDASCFLFYDFDNGDYSEFLAYANGDFETEEESESDLINESTNEEEINNQTETENGMVLLEGFLYSPDELADACKKVGLSLKQNDNDR